MPNVIVPDRPSKDVILIDGICYKLVGPTSNPKTHEMSDIDGQFDSCPECEAAEKSDLSSQSSSSGPAAQDCPAANSCGSCADSYTVVISGLTNGTPPDDCPDQPCVNYNGTWVLTKLDGGGGDDCVWYDPTFTIFLGCESQKWVIQDAAVYGCFRFEADNTNGCPPTSGYTANHNNCGGPGSVAVS